jgi:hypothetical protein
MINPRTIPYTPQRLMAIKHEISRPLPQARHSVLPFGTRSFDLLKETPQDHLQTRCLTVAGNPLLPTEIAQAAKLSPIKGSNSPSSEKTKNRLSSYAPYIIGGLIVTLAIYIYFQSRRAKEKEETNSVRL